MPSTSDTASVRFAEGAPLLEALVNGVPTDIGAAYLQVDGGTVTSSFSYGTITGFAPVPAGAHSLRVLDSLGYAVGPVKTPPLSGGKAYTVVFVGAYPNYDVLTFEEPNAATGAALSLYEASPAAPSVAFGRFRASGGSDLRELGRARLGSIETVSLGSSAADVGGYAGNASAPLGTVTPQQIDSFDSHNALPFHSAARLSLFLFDAKNGSSSGPVFGSLDR